jgi:hypothetical protein
MLPNEEQSSLLLRRYRTASIGVCMILFLLCSWRFVQIASVSVAATRSVDAWVLNELPSVWKAHEDAAASDKVKAPRHFSSGERNKQTTRTNHVEEDLVRLPINEKTIESRQPKVDGSLKRLNTSDASLEERVANLAKESGSLRARLDERLASATMMLSAAWRNAETHFRMFHTHNWWPLKRINLPVSVTTRKTKWKSLEQMALFETFLPSLMKTIEDGYLYGVYLGYDVGDPLLDKPDAEKQMRELWNRQTKGSIELKIFKYNDTVNRNVWAVNYLTKEAYLDGYDYFFRVNDDSEFRERGWTSKMVEALQLNDDFGAVGVLDDQNPRIWTHSFVARQHLEIFGFHFPFSFGNYWSDDWITQAYDSSFSIWLYDVPIVHHLHKERYFVDWKNSTERLAVELDRAHLRWRTWLCQAKGASHFCDKEAIKNVTVGGRLRGYDRKTLMTMENKAKEEQFKRMERVKTKSTPFRLKI